MQYELNEIVEQLKQININLSEIKNAIKPPQPNTIQPTKELKDVLDEVSNEMYEAERNIKLQDEQFKPLVKFLQEAFLGYLFSVAPQTYNSVTFVPERNLLLKKDEMVYNTNINVQFLSLEAPMDNMEEQVYSEDVSTLILKINEFLEKNNL